MKAIACTAIVCCTVFLLAVAGENDVLDAVQARILLTSPVPGFCEVLALPVDGISLDGGR